MSELHCDMDLEVDAFAHFAANNTEQQCAATLPPDICTMKAVMLTH